MSDPKIIYKRSNIILIIFTLIGFVLSLMVAHILHSQEVELAIKDLDLTLEKRETAFSNELRNITSKYQHLSEFIQINHQVYGKDIYNKSFKLPSENSFQYITAEDLTLSNIVEKLKMSVGHKHIQIEILDFQKFKNSIDSLANSSSQQVNKILFSFTFSHSIEHGKEQIFGVLMPLYEGTNKQGAGSKKKLLGATMYFFDLQEVFSASVLTKTPEGIDIAVLDITNENSLSVLIDHKSRTDGETYQNVEHYSDGFNYMGRKWQFLARPCKNFISSRNSYSPLIVAILGILSSLVLAMRVRRILKILKYYLHINTKLSEQANIDGLTLIPNRRCFDKQFKHEWHRAKRLKIPLSMVMIDVDYFKLFNDSYGHIAGDNALAKVANCLSHNLNRAGDFIARYGGEEFVIILPNTETPEIIAERCRRAVADLRITHSASNIENFMTISLGVASCLPTEDSTETTLKEYADKALYQAKNQGRNCVSIYNKIGLS